MGGGGGCQGGRFHVNCCLCSCLAHHCFVFSMFMFVHCWSVSVSCYRMFHVMFYDYLFLSLKAPPHDLTITFWTGPRYKQSCQVASDWVAFLKGSTKLEANDVRRSMVNKHSCWSTYAWKTLVLTANVWRHYSWKAMLEIKHAWNNIPFRNQTLVWNKNYYFWENKKQLLWWKHMFEKVKPPFIKQ